MSARLARGWEVQEAGSSALPGPIPDPEEVAACSPLPGAHAPAGPEPPPSYRPNPCSFTSCLLDTPKSRVRLGKPEMTFHKVSPYRYLIESSIG